jgi:hypothetical protein
MTDINKKALEAAHKTYWEIAISGTSRDALRAAIAAYEAALWQPIESAPKDGTEILLAKNHAVCAGYWAMCPQATAMMADKKYPWEVLDSTNGTNAWMDNASGPTEWRSLPSPPKGNE